MGRGPSQKGIEARQKILAELARRWEEFEPQPSYAELAAELGMSYGVFQHHLRGLRAAGLVQPPPDLWITRAGYLEIRGNTTLTNESV